MATPLTPFYITGYSKGIQINKKPFLLPDQAWQVMENVYCWREREKKREGLQRLGQSGRLERSFSNVNFFPTGASPWTFNLLTVNGYVAAADNANPGKVTTKYPHNLSNGDTVIFTGIVGATGYNNIVFTITVVDDLNFTVGVNAAGFGAYVSGGFFMSNHLLTLTTESDASLAIQNFGITLVGTGIQLADVGDGTLLGNMAGNSGTIDYVTGVIKITTTAPAATPTVINVYSYYPSLPVMGIPRRDINTINDEQTIWFDMKYAYVFTGTLEAGLFSEFIPGFAWNSSDSDFFWACNERGGTASQRLFFVTNFVNTSDNPMAYTDGATWTVFAPLSSATNTIFSARLIVSYYGRLLLLNTWEGTTVGGASLASNFYNRCSFSRYASNPVAADAFRVDILGNGGFIDAPTNESIVGAIFVKNTLIVQFEQSTWQLRYNGEYGTPFIWERTSSDFGSESTFSSVLFDNAMLSVGDKAITASNAVETQRIDLDIPDLVFNFKNQNEGVKRIFGVRDYQRELIFWNFADAQTQTSDGVPITFPNKVLVYNYRNQTYAVFRDNITAFGTFQCQFNIIWDSTTVTWDDNNVTWSDPKQQSLFPFITSGNQRGFVHLYGYKTPDDPSIPIDNIVFTYAPNSVQIICNNHNLQPGDIIQIDGLLFINDSTELPETTDLNGKIYQVMSKGLNAQSFYVSKWNFTNQNYQEDFSFTPSTLLNILYVGGGVVTLYPKLQLLSKDINIFQQKGMQTKLSRIDFLMETTNVSGITVNLFMNSSLSVKGNMLVGNKNVSTVLTPAFYVPSSDYAWFSFYATLYAQFFSVNLTYDDNLMNTLSTHEQSMTLLAMMAYVKQGGRNV